MARKPSERTHCLQCGKPFRGKHEYIKDHPGTVQHAARGICQGDYQKMKDIRAAYNTPLPTLDQLQGKAREDKKNLDSFLSRIRAQGQKDQRRARQRMVIR